MIKKCFSRFISGIFIAFLLFIIPCRGNENVHSEHPGETFPDHTERGDQLINLSNAGRGAYFFNVMEMGAAGNGSEDDSPAIQEALTKAGESSHGVVYLPEGRYLLKEAVTWARLSGSRALAGIAIRGDGVGKTIIIVDNDQGGIRLDDFFSNTQFQIRDLTILAARPDAGTAISAGKPGNRTGARGYRCFESENIEIRGLSEGDYFNKGITVTTTYRPFIKNVSFTGAVSPGDEFKAETGISVNWCHTPEIEQCIVKNVHTAYSYLSSPDDQRDLNRPEGGTFHSSIADNCIIGVDIDKPGNMPEFAINYCKVRARDIGIRISRKKFYQVRNNIFEPLLDPAIHEYKDISTLGSFMGVYHYNIFLKYPHQSDENMRTCMSFDTMDWRHDNGEMIIKHNIFPGTGTDIGGEQSEKMSSSSIIKNNSYADKLEAKGIKMLMYENYYVPTHPMELEITGPVNSVADYGAIGNGLADDSPAFQSALEDLVSNGGGILYIPAGRFLINKRIEIVISPETTPGTIAFRGEGPGVSQIICNNAMGVFRMTDSSGNVAFDFKNLGLYANKNGATAIYMESTGDRLAGYRTLKFRNIDIQPEWETFDSNIVFLNGIIAKGFSYPYFENLLHKSYADPKYEMPVNDIPEYGIYLENCDNISFIHCYVKKTKFAFYIKGKTSNNTYIYRSKGVGDFYGLYMDLLSPSTGLWVESCHFNETLANIYLKNINDFVIIDNLPYGPTDNTKLNDIELVNCSRGRISGNVFHSATSTNNDLLPESSRNAIIIRGDKSADIIIENNIFNAKGRALVLDEGIEGVVVRDNMYPNPRVEIPD